MRVAPAQTLRRMRELDPQARHAILAILRTGRLPAEMTVRGGVLTRLRLYLDRFSIRPGESLRAYHAYDGATFESFPPFWRIVRVDAIENATKPMQTRPSKVVILDSGRFANVATGLDVPFDRDAVGYQWMESHAYLDTGNWLPGLYAWEIDEAQTFDSRYERHAVAYFVVRPSVPKSYGLFCWPFMTLAVYAGRANAYESTYDWGVSKRQRRVSLDRPLDVWPDKDVPKINWCVRFPLLMWNFINQLKIPLDPCTSFDLHNEPKLLDSYSLFVSAGHDEYWSKEMRDHVESFVAGGGNAAFFGGNCCVGQVRVEGRTLVCYKSPVEDPVGTTSPERVTALWAAPPTSRPENSLTGVSVRRGGSLGLKTQPPLFLVAPNDPMLAGLSNLPEKFPSTSATLPDNTNAQWILDSECDGADFEVSRDGVTLSRYDMSGNPIKPGDLFKPTGLDGTPLNFRILAVADLTRFESGTDFVWEPGWATIGYFTNNGTVFTASTVAWADYLGDETVRRITTAVVKRLILRTQKQPAATFLQRENPPAWVATGTGSGYYPWQQLETGMQGIAIAAAIQGELLVMKPDGTIVRREMESPTYGSWQPTKMGVPLRSVAYSGPPSPPQVPDSPQAPLPNNMAPVSAMACDLHGRLVYCVARDDLRTKIWSFALPQAPATPWYKTDFDKGGADCLGLASTDIGWFAATADGNDRWLTHDARIIPGGKILRIGRWLHSCLTASGYDGKLFAVDRLGNVVARDATLGSDDVAVDLVWTQLGAAPRGTFALAACAGRLFALAGTPENASLYWRVAAPDAPYRDCPVFLLRKKMKWPHWGVGNEGVGAQALVGVLSQNGDFAVTEEIDIPEYDPERGDSDPERGDIAVQAGPSDILFYQADGSAALYRCDVTGYKTQVRRLAAWDGAFGAWTTIAYVRHGRLLFYNKHSGQAIIGRFVERQRTARMGGGSTPFFLEEWSGPIGTDWTHIVSSHDGVDGSPYVLLYDMESGAYGILTVAPNGTFVLRKTALGMSPGWDTIVPVGQTCVLMYNAATTTADLKPGDVALVEWRRNALVQVWTSVDNPSWGLEFNSFLLAGAGNGLVLRLREHQWQEVIPPDHLGASFGVQTELSESSLVVKKLVDLRTDLGPRLASHWARPRRRIVALGGS